MSVIHAVVTLIRCAEELELIDPEIRAVARASCYIPHFALWGVNEAGSMETEKSGKSGKPTQYTASCNGTIGFVAKIEIPHVKEIIELIEKHVEENKEIGQIKFIEAEHPFLQKVARDKENRPIKYYELTIEPSDGISNEDLEFAEKKVKFWKDLAVKLETFAKKKGFHKADFEKKEFEGAADYSVYSPPPAFKKKG